LTIGTNSSILKKEMKKTKGRKNFKLLSIVLLAVVLSTLLLINIVQRNGLAQKSQAASGNNKNTIPFICTPSCSFGTDFGNRLAGKDLTNAYIPSFSSQGNDFTGTVFVNARIGSIHSNGGDNFTNADFTNADLSNGQNTSADNFTNANFTGANRQNGGNDSGDNYTNANFTNANLTGMTFIDNTFTGAIWSNTTCADGTNSNNDGGSCIGHLNGQ